jgi:capsular exopolysaccharide synthesis family protein
MFRHESISVDAVANSTEQDNLRVITTGPLPPNPAELLGSKRMQAVLQRLQQESDLVIFDSPPLLAVADAAVLSSFLDGTIMVIDAAQGRRRNVRTGRETLSRAGATVLGAVLNRVAAATRFGYGGFYGHAEERPIDVVAERRGATIEIEVPEPAKGATIEIEVPEPAKVASSTGRRRRR